MIKTILCDLGNVVVFFDNNKIIKNLAAYSNQDEKYIYNFFQNSQATEDFDKGNINEIELFQNFSENLNLTTDFEQFKKIWYSCFSPNKDMENLLIILKKNCKLILLSNTDPIHFTFIRNKYKILDIFDDFVLSYKIGYKKPSQAIYLHAIKKAGTSPNEILFIDDIYEHVQAAKLLGIKSIQYTNFDRLKIDLKKLNILT